MSKKKYHLVTGGDSLFGASMLACGLPPTEETLKGKKEYGVFGEDGTFHMINCRKCMASVEYRAMCREMGLEHPFSVAAKKAHETMSKKDRW